ncbi:helix-turn-helix domain-containing protein [Nesterenkonia salmonea]|uniref:Helix-turn-helix domain-containing protein n=1 Tax=Nesterenkonia salmonea TaxID=1804987 RepID=A0A5R9BD56_9MICC|nr:helix-turn-helix domain-containing protein [Nesterenkonia salmonea]TLP98189.1 helix-turn-helix domain-containing protein [Nesterenkonia salmonea]
MGTEAVTSTGFTSTSLDAAEQFDAWQNAVNSAFVPLEAAHQNTGGFDGYLRGQPLGLLSITEVGGDPVHVRRSRRSISAGNPGVYKFALQRSGECLVRQDQQQALLLPGDLVIYDTTKPYDLSFKGPYGMFVVQIPHESMGLSDGQAASLVAQRIPGSTGLGALTSSLLTSLSQQLEREEMAPDPRAAAAVLQLVQATLLARLRPEPQVPTRDVVYLEAVSYIDKRLKDPHLSVSAVAQALHVSTRYLQAVFADEGTTVSEWIRKRRLEHCRQELSNTHNQSRSVSSIAAQWGYRDASSFTRSFRSTFGETPTDYRRRVHR